MNKLRDQSGGWAIVETAVAVVQKRSIQTIPAASTAGLDRPNLFQALLPR
jgi:hypothetical protein